MKEKATLHNLSQKLVEEKVIQSEIRSLTPVSGGSVNQTYCLRTAHEEYFLKVNQKEAFPDMFLKEKKGLDLLRTSTSLEIPQTIYCGELDDSAFLILEFINSANQTNDYWERFGEGLAELHRNSVDRFGLDYDNYNGSLIQSNSWNTKWIDFFIENRLNFQLKLAFDSGRVDKSVLTLFENLFPKLASILPEEKPALLHGDLWSGNFMTSQTGQPVIMDPAVYYGHREMDISMSMLFGGFHKRFYESYINSFPLEKAWEKRVDICNLYPLMVHVNLFGASYTQRVKSILKRLV